MEPISKNAYILYDYDVSSTLVTSNYTYGPEGVAMGGPGWRAAPDDAQPTFTFIFRHIVNIAGFRSVCRSEPGGMWDEGSDSEWRAER